VVAPSEGSGRLRSGTTATPDPSHITLPPLGWCAACYTAGKFMPAAEQPVGTVCSFHADKGPQRPAVGWFAGCVGAFRVTPIPGAPGAAKVVLDPGQLTRGLAHTQVAVVSVNDTPLSNTATRTPKNRHHSRGNLHRISKPTHYLENRLPVHFPLSRQVDQAHPTGVRPTRHHPTARRRKHRSGFYTQ
jgi:hypothetical protein